MQTREFAQVADGRRRAGHHRITRSTTSRSTRCISGWRRRSGLGRAFLVGDAAHINNPLGGMGMNGGIHDAVNLAARLAAVWRGDAPEAELDRFDKQRRLVTLEYIQKYTIQNKKNLESPGDEFRQSLLAIAADPARTREYLMRVSMIASLHRAEELG